MVGWESVGCLRVCARVPVRPVPLTRGLLSLPQVSEGPESCHPVCWSEFVLGREARGSGQWTGCLGSEGPRLVWRQRAGARDTGLGRGNVRFFCPAPAGSWAPGKPGFGSCTRGSVSGGWPLGGGGPCSSLCSSCPESVASWCSPRHRSRFTLCGTPPLPHQTREGAYPPAGTTPFKLSRRDAGGRVKAGPWH